MRARVSLLAAVLLSGQMIWAQTVEQGQKFFYYERYLSAKDAFEKTVAAKAGNVEAIYWLGQSLLELNQPKAAKDLYQNTLSTNGNAALVLAGMGHIELIEGKKDDARQRFEMAISLTKGKSVDVLNAVGRANALAPAGDATYAIEKLNQATSIKGFKDPEVFINMGNAYRKLADGGGAVTSYGKALDIDPKYAAAKYYIGKVYLSQDNREAFLPNFEEAIQMDPTFAPAFRELYFFYYFRDVNKAIDYLEKYVSNTDQTPEIEYERTSVFYAARKYQEAIDRANAILAAQGASANPKYHRLIAYSFESLGDSVKALNKINEFLGLAPAEMILPADYALRGNLLLKMVGQEEAGLASLKMALDKDTNRIAKLELADKTSTLLEKRGNLPLAADWKLKAYSFNKAPSKQDLFYTGYAFIKAQRYVTADSLFGIYSTSYPDEVYGHYWQARAQLSMDTTGENGKAVPHFTKFIEIAEKDPVTNKSTLITAYGYMASYSANVLKDKTAAIAYFDKILGIDPANADAQKFKEILQKQLTAPRPAGSGGTKPGNAGK